MFQAHLYHKKWPLIRRLVLQRAGYACEGTPLHPDCRAADRKAHPVTGKMVFLSVAHLDGNRDNNRFYNLRCVCEPCHLDHDRYEKTWGRKYGKALKDLQFELFPASELDKILLANQMFANPFYYTGRKPNSIDLCVKRLLGIHAGILESFGTKAAESFTHLVMRLPCLSAYHLVEALQTLYDNAWKLPACLPAYQGLFCSDLAHNFLHLLNAKNHEKRSPTTATGHHKLLLDHHISKPAPPNSLLSHTGRKQATGKG